MFRTLDYPITHKITSIVDWHAFIRKLTFHKGRVTKFHEAKVIPSLNALIQHYHRANYVLKLVYSSPGTECKELQHFEKYGWQQTGPSAIEVVWEQPDLVPDDQDSASSEESGEESDSDSDTNRDSHQNQELSYGSDSDSCELV